MNASSSGPHFSRSQGQLTPAGIVVLVLTAGIALSWIAIAYLPVPFIWVFGGWFAFFVAVARSSTRTVPRIIGINLAAVLGAFLVAEGFFLATAEPWAEADATSQAARLAAEESIREMQAEIEAQRGLPASQRRYQEYDLATVSIHEHLGYAPEPRTRVNGRRARGGEIFYDVIYTIDADGLRVAPPHVASDDPECLLFFGGSFTFGEGVADHEAMPYQVGIRTGGRYQVYNFGFRGYGPHQMLAALERGLVDQVLRCRPRHIFYQAIRAHIKRASGVRTKLLDSHSPRYRLPPTGELFYDGRFNEESQDAEASMIRRSAVYPWISKSYLLAEVHAATILQSERIDLLVAIVDAAREISETCWPGSEFHVILWDDRFELKGKLLESALEEKQFRIHRISAILPGYPGDRDRYRIHPDHERHPTAAAHALIAGYLAREMLAE